MNRSLFKKYQMLICIGMLLTSITSLKALVMWDNTMAPNVVNDNLVIDGVGGPIVLGAGGTLIQATTQNINVTLMNNPVVRGNNGAPSQLYINVASGFSVNFNIASNDLTFEGSSDASLSPLLIVVSGAGQTNFNVRGGQTVSFSTSTGRGGTQLYVAMQTGLPAGFSILRFIRDNTFFTNLTSTVNIGASSLIGFLSSSIIDNATDFGSIYFDPANSNATARFNLNIEDTGAYLIKGVLTTQVNPLTITQSDINRSIAAGQLAVTQVDNSLGSSSDSGLLVTNNNATQFELLVDPFGFQNAAADTVDYVGSFTGTQYGFVLGANGQLDILDQSYFDYVGLANNACPEDPNAPCGACGCATDSELKPRNFSAFFVDGNLNPASTPALITVGCPGAIFFRSGVDAEGVIENDLDSSTPFTVTIFTPGAGEFVFDVEGALTIQGGNSGDDMCSKVELLSLFVQPSGGPLFVGGSEVNFPLRTFTTTCGALCRYNKGAFLINNRVDFIDTSLAHTDENHSVCEKNDITSEPAYVGGEITALNCFNPRPAIAFYNSRFLLNTNAALTGLDLLVPNNADADLVCSDNLSKFVFYYNGYAIDNGTGRQLNLGTLVGSQACDGCAIISPDAHLDILQSATCTNDTAAVCQTLVLSVAANDSTINDQITDDITGQYSVNTIYLGHSSNISLGLDQNLPDPDNATQPTLKIAGNFFAFETRGGATGTPSLGGLTGQGIVFVGQNGLLTINSQYRASFNTMIVKCGTGEVDLPKSQIYFGNLIGITDWRLDLSTTQTIIPAGQVLADFTLNWRATVKDLANYVPYVIDSVNTCGCPPVTQENITSLPIIEGEVDQLLIQGSRMGDEASIMIDGGWVRELEFYLGRCSGEAPVAFVVLQNNGRIGLNTAHTTLDSVFAQDVLGVNGITIIANGDGQVDLNDDMVVNNVCSFLKGPDFQEGQVLTINADTEKALRVKPTGVLDFRSFSSGDTVRFSGQIRVILEPGAQILLDGVTLEFFDSAVLECEPLLKADEIFESIPLGAIDNSLSATTPTPAANPHNEFAPLTSFGAGLGNTDEFRVKIIGEGAFRFADRSGFYIPKDTFLGIETLVKEIEGDVTCQDITPTITCIVDTTNILVIMNDSAQFIIGDPDSLGGSFQVGNTQSLDGHSVSFQLNMNGTDAQFIVKSQGFVGFGVGIVDKRFAAPNEWYVDNLFNVDNISIIMADGLFTHDRTFDGDAVVDVDINLERANGSLIALGNYGETPNYRLAIEPQSARRTSNADIHGGGNMVLVTQASGVSNAGAIAPIVRTEDDVVVVDSGLGLVSSRYNVALLSSRIMMENVSDPDLGDLFTPTGFFLFTKVKDYFTSSGFAVGKATAAFKNDEFDLEYNALRIGYVDRDQIGRQDVYDIDDAQGGDQQARRQTAASVGGLAIQADRTQPAPAPVIFAQQIVT